MYSHQALFDKHYGELKLKYDEYDTEVYYNRSKQAKWDDWAKETLVEFDDFSMSDVEIGHE